MMHGLLGRFLKFLCIRYLGEDATFFFDASLNRHGAVGMEEHYLMTVTMMEAGPALLET